MPNLFINRPILAWVIAIIAMLAGGLAILKLPVAQYPTIALPAVTISTSYPGADAKTVQDTMTRVIEQNMNGIDSLTYMSSNSDSTGTMWITLTFESGTDTNIAQVQVQSRLQLAVPLLPQKVQQQGVSVEKSSNSFLIVIGVINTDGTMTQEDISNYMTANMKDAISRTSGVSDVQLFGSQYAMRIWMNPSELNKLQLTPVDVITTIKTQSAQVAAGRLGGTPPVKGQQLGASTIAQTRPASTKEFDKISLEVNQDGSRVLLRDVAEIELGGENYDIIAEFNDQPASGLGIELATGASALDTAATIRAELVKMEPFFPPSLETVYPYDTTPFVKTSIHEVVKTLVEAIILVFLVVCLFLQNFRATLVLTIAVSVMLLETFAALAAFGFSINTLTMFGMILAIGLLVDDVIAIVENAERVMTEEDPPPKEAARKSMGQIQGALVGIAMVLSAVFIPMALFGDSTGAIYRQFSITIISAIALSVLVVLILTPAFYATMLKPIAKGDHDGDKKGFFGWFNRMFEKSTHHYTDSANGILRSTGRYLVLYLIIVVGMAYLFVRLPDSLLPDEDQNVFMAMVQLPAGATQERTQKVLNEVAHYHLTKEKNNIESTFAVNGFGFAERGQNTDIAFVSLKNWADHPGEENKVEAITMYTTRVFSQIKDAMVLAFNLPATVGLGTVTGFGFELIDQAGPGREKLTQVCNQSLTEAAKHPDMLANARPSGLEGTPQFKIDIDQKKAQALGASINDINATLGAAWGSSYVNGFTSRGRVKKVYVISEAKYHMLPDDIGDQYVCAADGQIVPFSVFSFPRWEHGSSYLKRYNGLLSMGILDQTVPGKSIGEAMGLMEQLVSKLPTGVDYDWAGMSYQECLSGNQAPSLYVISLIVVFLCLAALYESWSIPFSVMLVVPLGVIGALLAATFRGLTNDVYFQVDLLTTTGLSVKNAILIVESAEDLIDKEGKGLIEATLDAVRVCLRPILMTSLVFIFGVMPLVISTGAGSGAQNIVGIGIMGRMVAATVLTIFFVPVFFMVVRHRFSRKNEDTEHSHTVDHHRYSV